MILIKHAFRALTRPYYVALAQTIGDYCYLIAAAYEQPSADPRTAVILLARFDRLVASAARNSNRDTLRIATEHWAHRVAAPASVRAMSSLFTNVNWFQASTMALMPAYRGGGSGLAFFQQALKDSGVINIRTLREELGQ